MTSNTKLFLILFNFHSLVVDISHNRHLGITMAIRKGSPSSMSAMLGALLLFPIVCFAESTSAPSTTSLAYAMATSGPLTHFQFNTWIKCTTLTDGRGACPAATITSGDFGAFAWPTPAYFSGVSCGTVAGNPKPTWCTVPAQTFSIKTNGAGMPHASMPRSIVVLFLIAAAVSLFFPALCSATSTVRSITSSLSTTTPAATTLPQAGDRIFGDPPVEHYTGVGILTSASCTPAGLNEVCNFPGQTLPAQTYPVAKSAGSVRRWNIPLVVTIMVMVLLFSQRSSAAESTTKATAILSQRANSGPPTLTEISVDTSSWFQTQPTTRTQQGTGAPTLTEHSVDTSSWFKADATTSPSFVASISGVTCSTVPATGLSTDVVCKVPKQTAYQNPKTSGAASTRRNISFSLAAIAMLLLFPLLCSAVDATADATPTQQVTMGTGVPTLTERALDTFTLPSLSPVASLSVSCSTTSANDVNTNVACKVPKQTVYQNPTTSGGTRSRSDISLALAVVAMIMLFPMLCSAAESTTPAPTSPTQQVNPGTGDPTSTEHFPEVTVPDPSLVGYLSGVTCSTASADGTSTNFVCKIPEQTVYQSPKTVRASSATCKNIFVSWVVVAMVLLFPMFCSAADVLPRQASDTWNAWNTWGASSPTQQLILPSATGTFAAPSSLQQPQPTAAPPLIPPNPQGGWGDYTSVAALSGVSCSTKSTGGDPNGWVCTVPGQKASQYPGSSGGGGGSKSGAEAIFSANTSVALAAAIVAAFLVYPALWLTYHYDV